jgi:outer membrane protein assembly factor BamD (BamD/ComL family)
MYMRSKTLRLVIVCFAAAVLVAACATTVVIPEDLTAAELVQRGQEASDRNRYNNALQYYQAVLERFPYNAEFV